MSALPTIESQRVDLCPAGRPVRPRRRYAATPRSTTYRGGNRKKTREAISTASDSGGHLKTAAQPQNQAVPGHRSHRPMAKASMLFASMWSSSGAARFGAVARRITRRGSVWLGWRPPFCPFRVSSILGRTLGSVSLTLGGSRVPKSGPLGFVRGALSNGRPYRDQ